MSSIREVARVAGVSVATVSRTLSSPEKVSTTTLEKVHRAIEKVQYRPNMLARNFRSTRAFSIVVLVPDITNPFFSTVIRGIEDQAQKQGYAVLLGDTRDTRERERDYVRLVETRLADGVIQLSPHSGKVVDPADNDIAYVNACGCETTPAPSVRVDNVGGAQTMVDYLIGLGHRRIGVISGLEDNPHTMDRLRGYKLSLERAGIEFRDELVAGGNFTMWSGLEAARHFCDMDEPPTAIFCMNDEMAIGAIQTLKACRFRVPEDISVTGFDNIQYSKYWDPALTTIAQPAEAMGKTATEVLIKVIEGEKPEQSEYVLPYEFIERASSKKIKV